MGEEQLTPDGRWLYMEKVWTENQPHLASTGCRYSWEGTCQQNQIVAVKSHSFIINVHQNH